MTRKITREELEDGRYDRSLGYLRIFGYKHSYCELMGSCDECDKRIRFGCKIINKIADIQTKRILKICNTEEKNT